MKKNLIKKVFAVSLSIAMACSFLPTANPVTASAAAPFVTLKTTFKTLKVGQKYQMTLKNNTINWKIRKVETTNKPIATVYGKTTKQVMIKGKSEGRATIRVHVRTTERKKNNTKTLRCRVKVVPAQTTTPEPTQTEATVTTPEELTTALSNTNIAKITIKPAGAVNFTIPQATYSNVDLVVDAPQSDIDNSATFKSVRIDNIKAETWTERGKNNTFDIRAAKASIKVEEGAVVSRITLNKADAELNVVLNKGTVTGINLSTKGKLNVSGTKADGAAAIAISVAAEAAESTITTDVPADVSSSAKITVVFEKNAKGSTVRLLAANISITITNRTSANITVTRNDGTTRNVAANSTSTITSAATTPVYPGGSTGGGSTGGGSSSTLQPGQVPEVIASDAFEAQVVTGASVEVTTSSALNVKLVNKKAVELSVPTSGGSIWTVDGSSETKGATMKVTVQVLDGNTDVTSTVGGITKSFVATNGKWNAGIDFGSVNIDTTKVKSSKLTVKVTVYIEPYATYEGNKLVKRYTKAGRKTVFMTTHTVSAAPAE